MIWSDACRVGQQGEGAGDLDQRKGVGQDATVVTGGDQIVGRDAERPGDSRTDRHLAWMVGLPIIFERPAGVMTEQDAGGVEAGAHVPDGARRFAVACQPDPGQLVQGRPGRPAGEQVLAQRGASEDGLEGADVEVLTMMRGGHHGQLGIGQVELVGGSGLDQCEQREGLDGAAQRDHHVGIAGRTLDRAVAPHLDHVTAVAALGDRPTPLLDEDGSGDIGRPRRGAPVRPGTRRSRGAAGRGRRGTRSRPRLWHGSMVSRIAPDRACRTGTEGQVVGSLRGVA